MLVVTRHWTCDSTSSSPTRPSSPPDHRGPDEEQVRLCPRSVYPRTCGAALRGQLDWIRPLFELFGPLLAQS